MKCVNCGAELAEDARFCSACGANQTDLKVEKNTELNSVRICPFCGAENDADAKFCEKCGKDMDSVFKATINQRNTTAGLEVESACRNDPENKNDLPGDKSLKVEDDKELVQESIIYCPFCGAKNECGDVYCAACGRQMSLAEEEETPRKSVSFQKRKKKLKRRLIIATAVVAFIGGSFFGLKGNMQNSQGKEQKTVLYTQDDRVYMVDFEKTKMEPVELAGDASTDLNMYVSLSKMITPDSKYLCYLVLNHPNKQELYLKKLDSKKEAVKLAEGVNAFKLLDEGTVIYQDNEAIYRTNYNGKKKRIGTNVSNWSNKRNAYLVGESIWQVTENQKYVIWLGEYDENNGYYDGLYYSDIALKTGEKKLVSAVNDLVKVTANGDRVYYLDDDDLYVIKNFKDKEKVASNVIISSYMGDDGSFYYLKSNKELVLADLVEDDLESEDQGVIDRLETDYNAAKNQFEKVQIRNQIRDILNDSELSGTVLKEYCKCSDRGEDILEEKIFFQDGWDQNTAGIGYLTYSEDNPVRMSDIYYEFWAGEYENVTGAVITDIIRDLIEKEGCYKYCDDNGAIPLSENLKDVFCDETGSTGYGVIIDTYTNQLADLYTFPLTGKEAGLCKLYDEDIRYLKLSDLYGNIKAINICGGNIYYFKNFELYMNKKLIDTDAVLGFPYQEDGNFYYMKKGKTETEGYAFFKCDNGKPVKIADDVFRYYIFNKDSIVLLKDYNINRFMGTLVYYNGKDIVKVADDVGMVG